VDIYFEKTVGVRCPSDATASALLSEANVPVVAASANRAGRPAPVDPDDVLRELDGKIDLLIDAGRVRYEKPSTIVRLNGDDYEILRHGVLDERTIKRLTTLHILFVCTGNTCRSPMAEALCRRLLADRLGCQTAELQNRGYRIESAGVVGLAGGYASPNAVQAMQQRGVDLTGHFSQPLTVELIHQADYIYTMTASHLETVLSMVPSAADRAATLLPDSDIADPVGLDETGYQQCAQTIERALQRRLTEMPL
jgi:protein-tyrosine phosphatase